MASISFGWEDVWAYYPSALPETQRDILKSLESYLKSVSPSAQVKALEDAPMSIIEKHACFLHANAKKKLGLDVKETKKKSFGWKGVFG